LCSQTEWYYRYELETCFEFIPNVNWFDGVKACDSLGGHPVKITDCSEARAFTNTVSGPIWLGVRNSNRRNEFYWKNEFVQASFVQWGTGEPKYFQSSNSCVVFDKTASRYGQWITKECSSIKLEFACAKDP
ncbi:hypothetical protein RRG08_060928, partial [Elysia crispata]